MITRATGTTRMQTVKLIGLNFVDNIPVYFDKDGKQVKGRFAEDGRYYDKNSGALVTKRYLETEDNWVYVNDKGDKLKENKLSMVLKSTLMISLVHKSRTFCTKW
ncbi:MAG: hypothetical protein ACLTZB_05700 [Streptococcus salivarius]